MSAVLRKKIMSGNGVPPSILQLQAFWTQIRKRAGQWAEDALGTEGAPEITIRRSVSGSEVRAALDSGVSFAYPFNVAPGLCAITMDETCVAGCAARRMKEPRDSFLGASQLFLKLLCEESASALWACVAKDLDHHNSESGATSTGDTSVVAGQLATDCRYLEVGLSIPVEDDKANLRLFFDLEYVQVFSRDFEKNAASRKAESRHHSPDALRKSVQTSMVSIEAILDRLELTIGQCSRLEVGSVLPLPEAQTSRLSITAETINGKLDIGTGELGVWKHNRALKLSMPILESFVSDVADL